MKGPKLQTRWILLGTGTAALLVLWLLWPRDPVYKGISLSQWLEQVDARNATPAAQVCWDGDGNSKGKGERKETCPVAAHPRARSPQGLEDLAGNVREWTATENGSR